MYYSLYLPLPHYATSITSCMKAYKSSNLRLFFSLKIEATNGLVIEMNEEAIGQESVQSVLENGKIWLQFSFFSLCTPNNQTYLCLSNCVDCTVVNEHNLWNALYSVCSSTFSFNHFQNFIVCISLVQLSISYFLIAIVHPIFPMKVCLQNLSMSECELFYISITCLYLHHHYIIEWW